MRLVLFLTLALLPADGTPAQASPAPKAAGARQKPGKARNQKVFSFIYCEAEYGRCTRTCRVELLEGTRLALGSKVRVIGPEQGLIAEGYILKHRSGEIYILESKKDAKDDTICGGCCGDAISIDIAGRAIWGC